jgi:hypothetical protein
MEQWSDTNEIREDGEDAEKQHYDDPEGSVPFCVNPIRLWAGYRVYRSRYADEHV